MDTLQVIEKVNSFYSHSFDQLITLTIAVLAFSGIVLPIIIQLIQWRSFRVDQKSLESLISSEIDLGLVKLKDELSKNFNTEKEKIQNELSIQTKKLEDDFRRNIDKTKSGIFFIQGSYYFKEKQYDIAAENYALAAKFALSGDDEMNAQRALENLLKRCINNLNCKSFEDNFDLSRSIDDLLDILEEKNVNKRYYDKINEIKKGCEIAKKKSD